MENRLSRSCLFDYFLVSEISDYDLQSNDTLEKEINIASKPRLLWRFPKDRKENPWNKKTQDTLLQLCHPGVVPTDWAPTNRHPHFHSFLSTRDDGFRFYGHVLTIFYPLSTKIAKDNLENTNAENRSSNESTSTYAQRCICLISRSPYINTSEKVLRTLYKIFTENSSGSRSPALPVESYIHNLLFELAIPHPGQSLALKWDSEATIVIQRPHRNELPLLDIHLSTAFDLLGGPSNVLKLLTSAFLEHQILLVSEDCHKLMLIAEAITSLMFPFKWLHTYVPVFPFDLASHFLDAPVPYIMGIPLKSSDEMLTRIGSEFDQCFVNIDKGIVECPEDQPLFPDQSRLLLQLMKVYKTCQPGKSLSKIEPVIEEDGQLMAAPMHRRNAQRPNKKKVANSEDCDADILSNLHAVVRPSEYLRSDEIAIAQDLFNVKIREVIFGTLVSLLSQYDQFVILPESDGRATVESWVSTRDSENFDKASFLSDQRESDVTFLSPFLETQTFASLIDGYILAHLDMSYHDPALTLFDERIGDAKNRTNPDKSPDPVTKVKYFDQNHEWSRSLSILSAGRSAKLRVDKWIESSESSITKRHRYVNGRYPIVKSLDELSPDVEMTVADVACFPNIMFPSILLCTVSEDSVEDLSEISLPQEKPKVIRQPSVSELSMEMIARTNWKFLEKLLKDVKSKTNKLVVCKLGQDDYRLGHAHISLLGVEENTLIGSLCDLLERTWSHGLNPEQKRGKSALWSHLLQYEESSIRIMGTPQVPVLYAGEIISGLGIATPAMISPILPDEEGDVPAKGERFQFPPIKCDIISNIKRIKNLSEVKTNIGKCRAWIRLALEQKQLQAHLKKLLVDRPLLQTIYKRYSLLRCEEEREQFFYHLLALNTVDFSCFSNCFTKTVIDYRVWIFPKKQLSGISQTTANVKIMISGESSCTDIISVPKNCNDFIFPHRNLGVLRTVLFGHDNSGLLPKWYIDYIVIRNELTGQAYLLPCGRPLGHTVEDGSTQRLLIAYAVPLNKDLNIILGDIRSGSLIIQAHPVSRTISGDYLRDLIGQCINGIVQHLTKNSHSQSCAGILTKLLLKPDGLVALLTILFENGLKSSGLFRKRHLAWDVIKSAYDTMSGKVVKQGEAPSYKTALLTLVYNTPDSSPKHISSGRKPELSTNARQEGGLLGNVHHKTEALKNTIELDRLLNAIEIILAGSTQGLGKEDMFQLLICVGLRLHLLPVWLQLISTFCIEQSGLYDKNAFMLDGDTIRHICRLLNSLGENSINFELIIWRGIDSLNNV